MNVHAAIFRGQARTIEDAVDAWKADHDEAMRVRDLETIIAVALQAEALLRQGQADLWKALYADEISNTQVIGEAGRAAYGDVCRAFSLLSGAVRDAGARGYEIASAAAFAQAEQRLAALQQDFERRWPYFDPAELAAGAEEARRGEFVDAEEIRRGLQDANRS